MGMENDDDKPTAATPAVGQPMGHALAVPQELATDIMTKLRKLPHEDVDSILKQLGSCQIVQLTAAPGNGEQ